MADDYTDINGILRRPGSLVLPKGFVSALPPFEGQPEIPLWSYADIRKVVADTDRPDMEELMPFAKYGMDQRSTSACNSYMAASMYNAARLLRGIKDDFVAAGSFLYTFINGGRDNGSMLEDGMLAAMEHGFAPATLVKWNMIFTKQIPKAAFAEALKHKSFKAYRVMTMQGMRTALAARYQVGVAVHVGPSWDRRSNGVQGIQAGNGNHAVHLFDLKVDGKRFLYPMKNSWGEKFGDNGCTLLLDGHFKQTMPNHAFYAIPTTEEN